MVLQFPELIHSWLSSSELVILRSAKCQDGGVVRGPRLKFCFPSIDGDLTGTSLPGSEFVTIIDL